MLNEKFLLDIFHPTGKLKKKALRGSQNFANSSLLSGKVKKSSADGKTIFLVASNFFPCSRLHIDELQEVKLLLEVLRCRLVQMLSDQHGQLVSVLEDSCNACAAAPVVVEMCVLVRQHLQLLRHQSVVVVDDVVAGGRDSSLPDRLVDQEEVVTGSGSEK